MEGEIMSNEAKREYIAALRELYRSATCEQKRVMLDQCCELCGYHRKYAIRLLNGPPSENRKAPAKRGRKKRYDHPHITDVLVDIWRAANLPCSKRLKALIPIWLPHYNKFILEEEIKEKLLSISPATIDRLMAKYRAKFTKRGLATTKPGALIKKRIPVKTNQWDESVPGFLEVDTVAHCGSSTAETYVNTINCVDIATAWTIQRAIWGKGQLATLKAIQDIENTLPFPIQGFDCDNGSEFLNWHLVRYFTERKHPVRFTRARAYHRNDNAHVENKNWTHVRQFLGYQRFEQPTLVDKLNDLYTTEWYLYFNFFIPSVKLIDKQRVASKIIKRHDAPKTPFQRVLESEHISTQTKEHLQELYSSLNPFELYNQINTKIKAILKEAQP